MGVISRLLGRDQRRVEKVAGTVTANPVLMEALRLFDGGLTSYGTVYRKLPPVRTTIDFMADAVATTPVKTYRRADHGRPEARGSRTDASLRHPNPDLTTYRLIWRTTADLAIYGNAYWRLIPAGDTFWLVPLPVFRVNPMGGDLLAPRQYDFYPVGSAGPVHLSADEVVHFRLYDPEDPRIGSSKLEALRAILQEEVEASRNRVGFWRNAARNEGWLERDLEAGPLTQTQATVIRESLEEKHSGASNSGHVGVLPEGTHFKTGAFSPRESEFLDGRRFVLEATARTYNIPLSLLGLTDTATYASQREFHKQLYTEVLPPYFELIQSEIELQLMPRLDEDPDEQYVEFLVESKLRGDFVDQIEIFAKALGGGSTPGFMLIEEVRDKLNLPELDDPRARELVVPLNVSLSPSAPAPGEAPVEAATTPSAANTQAIAAFFDRQERVLRSKIGAGQGAFDLERWTRELAPLLGTNGHSRALAERVNLQTYLELQDADPAEVFSRAKSERAGAIAQEITPALAEGSPADPEPERAAQPVIHLAVHNHLPDASSEPPVVVVQNQPPQLMPQIEVPVQVQVEPSVIPAPDVQVMAPEVHVESPQVHVEAPSVNVEVPEREVKVHVEAAQVHVPALEAPHIEVAVPETVLKVEPTPIVFEPTVEAPSVTVVTPPAPRRRTVKTPERDPDTGAIVRVVEEEIDG